MAVSQRFGFFPFRYKLASMIIGLLLFSLITSLWFLQVYLHGFFTQRIHKDLKQARSIVAQLMESRRRHLIDYSLVLKNNNLIRIMLRESQLDEGTRNDILESEILPSFPDIDVLMVFTTDGQASACSIQGKFILPQILESHVLSQALKGEPSSDYFFHEDACFQLVSEPVFEGGILTHIVLIGFRLDEQFIQRVKDLSDVELAFLRPYKDKFQVFASSQWGSRGQQSEKKIELLEKQAIWNGEASLLSLKLVHEQFILFQVELKDHFTPNYWMGKSLDKELAFVAEITLTIVFIGLFVALAAIFMSFYFSKGVSRPIQKLQEASFQIEKGSLDVQVDICTKDEFRLLGQSFNSMVSGLKEKERIRGVMDKVVSKEIAEEMLKGEVQLGGEERQASILFSDIRGFTALSESMSPQDLLHLLNAYFTRANQCIESNHGVIDKYIGDAIMALFGAPISKKKDTVFALKAALDMISCLNTFNQDYLEGSSLKLKMGIGINTGLVVSGNMGAASRLNYTVIGDEVNLASRLEGLSKYYSVDIVLSESTVRQALKEDPACLDDCFYRKLDCVQVKGKEKGVDIYELKEKSFMKDPLDLKMRFEQALSYLFSQEFYLALEGFKHLLEIYPQDSVSLLMLKRVQRYHKDPQEFFYDYPDGAYYMREK